MFNDQTNAVCNHSSNDQQPSPIHIGNGSSKDRNHSKVYSKEKETNPQVDRDPKSGQFAHSEDRRNMEWSIYLWPFILPIDVYFERENCHQP
jgi:hypothetical protein